MCKKLIKNSQPFGKKFQKTLGGDFFDSHCIYKEKEQKSREKTNAIAHLVRSKIRKCCPKRTRKTMEERICVTDEFSMWSERPKEGVIDGEMPRVLVAVYL